MAFSSDRILTVKELNIGETIHSGFTGGFCVKWEVIAKDEQKAFLKHKNGTQCFVDGHQLRASASYHSDNCPNCELQHSIDDSSPEVKFLRQDLPQPVIASNFRFTPAQHVIRRRYR